ncbi:hypothetical protein Hanom_Chr15g01412211 [Helianthus anomalus]
MDHPCTFGKSWGLNTLQSANHRDHSCTFEKLGTKSKIFVNHSPQGPCVYFNIFLHCLYINVSVLINARLRFLGCLHCF